MYDLRKISLKSLQNCEGGKLRKTLRVGLYRLPDFVLFANNRSITYYFHRAMLRRVPDRCTRSRKLGSARAEALSYSAVKLISKYSNLRQKHTSVLNLTDGRTDDLSRL